MHVHVVHAHAHVHAHTYAQRGHCMCRWGADDYLVLDQHPRGFARLIDGMVRDTLPPGDSRVVLNSEVHVHAHDTCMCGARAVYTQCTRSAHAMYVSVCIEHMRAMHMQCMHVHVTRGAGHVDHVRLPRRDSGHARWQKPLCAAGHPYDM